MGFEVERESTSEVRLGSGWGCRESEMRLWFWRRTCWERARPRPEDVPVISHVGFGVVVAVMGVKEDMVVVVGLR